MIQILEDTVNGLTRSLAMTPPSYAEFFKELLPVMQSQRMISDLMMRLPETPNASDRFKAWLEAVNQLQSQISSFSKELSDQQLWVAQANLESEKILKAIKKSTEKNSVYITEYLGVLRLHLDGHALSPQERYDLERIEEQAKMLFVTISQTALVSEQRSESLKLWSDLISQLSALTHQYVSQRALGADTTSVVNSLKAALGEKVSLPAVSTSRPQPSPSPYGPALRAPGVLNTPNSLTPVSPDGPNAPSGRGPRRPFI